MSENSIVKKSEPAPERFAGAKFTALSGLLFTIAVYFYDMRYMVLHGRTYLDSDMASEMILADKLNQEKAILSTDWFYSTELRVFSMQWFYRLGLLLFPSDWSMARVIGEGLALILLALGAFLLVRKLYSDGTACWAAGFSLCPLGFWYFWQTIYGGYYIPYALFSLYSIILILDCIEAKNKRTKLLCYLGLTFLALGSGLQGVRQLMVLYAPLLVALFFVRNKKQLAPPIVYCFVLNAAGYVFNSVVLAKIYSFESKNDMVWGNGSGSWIETLKWYFYGFGYTQNCMTGLYYSANEAKLFSFEGISTGLGLLLGFAVFGAFLYLLPNLKKLNDKEHFMTVTVVSMLFVIEFVFTYLYGEMQYWQQTMVFGMIVLIIAVKNMPWEKLNLKIPAQNMPLIALSAVAVVALISGKGTANASMKYPAIAKPGLSHVAEWIVENTPYRKGIADFWYSNALTEWTNGELEMYTVVDASNPSIGGLHDWLQCIHHFEDFPEHDYVLVCAHRDDMYAGTPLMTDHHAECIFDDGEYCVFAVE